MLIIFMSLSIEIKYIVMKLIFKKTKKKPVKYILVGFYIVYIIEYFSKLLVINKCFSFS